MNAEQHWTAAKQDEIDELEKVVNYLVQHITAQIITDLESPTKEVIAKDIGDIMSGVTNEDDQLVIDQFQANK